MPDRRAKLPRDKAEARAERLRRQGLRPIPFDFAFFFRCGRFVWVCSAKMTSLIVSILLSYPRVRPAVAGAAGTPRRSLPRKARDCPAFSRGSMTVSAVSPCLSALRRDCTFPFSVCGPVLLSALRRFASSCRSEVMDRLTSPPARPQLGPPRRLAVLGSDRFEHCPPRSWFRMLCSIPAGEFSSTASRRS
jgi:hypothetical protein